MASLPNFPAVRNLPHLQHYVREMCAARGWDQANDLEIFLLLTEEVGELAKAIRKHKAIFGQPTPANPSHLADEFADVFSYLLDLANRMNVDLEMAFLNKEEKNRHRSWE